MVNFQEAEVLAAYAAGVRIFARLELDDRMYNFSGAVLTEADFSGSFITADFRGADLRGAKFIGCNVKTSDYRNADLRGASFAGAAIDGAEFAGVLLDGAIFEGASNQGHTYNAQERPYVA